MTAAPLVPHEPARAAEPGQATSLPTLSQLNTASAADFMARLATVWEHAPWVAQACVAQRPFDSVDALHRAMLGHVRSLPEPELLALLAGHPDLAGAAARSGHMAPDSVAEQSALSLDQLDADDAARWDHLNTAYRARFGFPFILCVKRHSRISALRCFEARLQNDRSSELQAALDEITRITRLRLADRIANHGLSGLSGRLSTHVLDVSRGRPAAGLHLSLHECPRADGPADERPLARAVTDAQGQTPAPLIDGVPLRIGRYELRFRIGDYYRDLGQVSSDWPFLDVVPVAFGIDEPEADYHVPLTITPWAFSTYRGQ
jgi:2-oxo-4-hydroxy-4-carboxy-5-ureidoimidazoline decarboxylase